MKTPTALVLVALGGAIGALLRAGIAFWIPRSDPAAFPLNTLIVNLVGCFLMGALVWLVLHVWIDRAWPRPFFGAGVLGGFTTFSAFAGELVLMTEAGAWVLATAYLVITILGGVLLIRAGAALAQRLLRRRGVA